MRHDDLANPNSHHAPAGFGRRGLLATAVLASAAPSLASIATPAAAAAEPGPGGTVTLAAYGAGLRYEDIPPAALQRAKDCMIDAVATIVYGADLPWSRMIIDYVRGTGGGGRSRILGTGSAPVTPAARPWRKVPWPTPSSSTTSPSRIVAAIPARCCSPPVWPWRRTGRASGKALLTALVAGAEVMIRIGYATEHTDEETRLPCAERVRPVWRRRYRPGT